MILPLLFLNAVTAFVTLFTFKVALFALSVSGPATGLWTFARLGLCLGWDVVGAVLVSLLAGLPLRNGRWTRPFTKAASTYLSS